MRAVRAHARIAVAQRLIPRVDTPSEPRSPRDYLRGLLGELAVQLHLVKDVAGPERKVLGPARVDAAAAGFHVGLDPAARAAVRQRPGEAGEDARPVRPQELVGDHEPLQSRKALISRSFASVGMSSSRTSPRVSTVVLICSTYHTQP